MGFLIKSGACAAKTAAAEAALQKREELLKQREERLRHQDDLCRVYMINPDRICPSPNQPRAEFDEAAIVALADSIRQHGIIQPLSVRRITDEDTPLGGLYELIAGERRLRAAKLLALAYVPCIIIDAEPPQAAQLTLTENLLRTDLNMFEEAVAIATLCGKYGLTQAEAARALSVSQPYIANKLRLLKLTEGEKELALKHGLSERHVRALVKLSEPEEREAALNAVVRKELNVRQTEEYVARLLGEGDATQSRAPRRIVIKDIRIFLNTIDRAVGIVKQAGIPVEQTRCDEGGMIELTIRVPANSG